MSPAVPVTLVAIPTEIWDTVLERLVDVQDDLRKIAETDTDSEERDGYYDSAFQSSLDIAEALLTIPGLYLPNGTVLNPPRPTAGTQKEWMDNPT